MESLVSEGCLGVPSTPIYQGRYAGTHSRGIPWSGGDGDCRSHSLGRGPGSRNNPGRSIHVYIPMLDNPITDDKA